MIKLMYITNQPEVAKIAENSGVDIIFIDLELMGKEERQGHLDTVISRHSFDDIAKVKKVLKNSKLMVRINPFYNETHQEVDRAIAEGADIIMLPMIQNGIEAKKMIEYIDGRAEFMPLIERREAVDNIEDIVSVEKINEIHIGLNDLHLSYGNDFMFEPLINGTVEKIVKIARKYKVNYGIGGIARLHTGDLPAEIILTEHYRLGSNKAILSRSFYNTKLNLSDEEISNIFNEGVTEIRNYELKIQGMSKADLEKNRIEMKNKIEDIIKTKRESSK